MLRRLALVGLVATLWIGPTSAVGAQTLGPVPDRGRLELADDTHLYFLIDDNCASGGAGDRVVRMPRLGGAVQLVVQGDCQADFQRLARSDAQVFVKDIGRGQIAAVQLSDLSSSTLHALAVVAGDPSATTRLWFNRGWLYWADSVGVHRIRPDGTDHLRFVQGEYATTSPAYEIAGLVVGGDLIYYVEHISLDLVHRQLSVRRKRESAPLDPPETPHAANGLINGGGFDGASHRFSIFAITGDDDRLHFVHNLRSDFQLFLYRTIVGNTIFPHSGVLPANDIEVFGAGAAYVTRTTLGRFQVVSGTGTLSSIATTTGSFGELRSNGRELFYVEDVPGVGRVVNRHVDAASVPATSLVSLWWLMACLAAAGVLALRLRPSGPASP